MALQKKTAELQGSLSGKINQLPGFGSSWPPVATSSLKVPQTSLGTLIADIWQWFLTVKKNEKSVVLPTHALPGGLEQITFCHVTRSHEPVAFNTKGTPHICAIFADDQRVSGTGKSSLEEVRGLQRGENNAKRNIPLAASIGVCDHNKMDMLIPVVRSVQSLSNDPSFLKDDKSGTCHCQVCNPVITV